MWMKLYVTADRHLGGSGHTVPMMINFDHVAQVNEGQVRDTISTKLTMHDGRVVIVLESLDKLEAELRHSLDTVYVAPSDIE